MTAPATKGPSNKDGSTRKRRATLVDEKKRAKKKTAKAGRRRRRQRREFGSIVQRVRDGVESENYSIKFPVRDASTGKTKTVWRCIGPDRDEAVERLAEIRAAIIREKREGGSPAVIGQITFARFRKKVLANWKARQSEENYATNRGRYERFVEYFGDRRLSSIRPSDVEDFSTWLSQRSFRSKAEGGTTGPATVRRYLSLMSTVLTMAVKRGYAKENPVKRADKPNEPDYDVPFIPAKDVDRIAAHCVGKYADIRDVVVLAFETGMRRGQLLGLDRRRDLDWDSGEHGEFIVRRNKPNLAYRVPMTEKAAEIVRARCERLGTVNLRGENKLFPEWAYKSGPDRVSKIFRKVAAEAGFEGMRLHEMKHGAGSNLAQLGVPLPVIQKILGHKRLETTMRYARHCPNGAEAAAMALFSNVRETGTKKKRRAK